MNRDHSVIFDTAPMYCISVSFVDSEGYSISSKRFLPTVVDIVVIWIKFTHSSPLEKEMATHSSTLAWNMPWTGAWWAAVYGVTQSRTRLKWLSRWTEMGEFNSDDHYIYYCGQESLRRNGVAIMVKKESEIQYLDAISKMTEWSLFISKANHSISQ